MSVFWDVVPYAASGVSVCLSLLSVYYTKKLRALDRERPQ
jgi:hypothetical protein